MIGIRVPKGSNAGGGGQQEVWGQGGAVVRGRDCLDQHRPTKIDCVPRTQGSIFRVAS